MRSCQNVQILLKSIFLKNISSYMIWDEIIIEYSANITIFVNNTVPFAKTILTKAWYVRMGDAIHMHPPRNEELLFLKIVLCRYQKNLLEKGCHKWLNHHSYAYTTQYLRCPFSGFKREPLAERYDIYAKYPMYSFWYGYIWYHRLQHDFWVQLIFFCKFVFVSSFDT